MIPFGQALYLWRRERGLTQEALASQARISRPNLSAIERGKREITLGTLRALAASLNVRPGVLADGLAPETGEARHSLWSPTGKARGTPPTPTMGATSRPPAGPETSMRPTAEGRGPMAGLTRAALERVANAVVGRAAARNAHEAAIVAALRNVISHRRAALQQSSRSVQPSKRATQAAWVWLEATYPEAVLSSLLQRVTDRLAHHD